MRNERVLVVEDDPDILELIGYNLQQEGFDVLLADSGERGLQIAAAQRPSLVLLDLMLPTMPGLEVCKQLRQRRATRDIPVIMVTAKAQEADVVSGLELGADDYVTKPFRIRELVARVRAVLRRAAAPVHDAPGERSGRGPLTVDPARHEVTVYGEPVDLTLAEYRLLEALVSRPGHVFPRARLVARITNGAHHISERNVDVHVAALRRKLGSAGDMIVTVRGIGYKLQD